MTKPSTMDNWRPSLGGRLLTRGSLRPEPDAGPDRGSAARRQGARLPSHSPDRQHGVGVGRLSGVDDIVEYETRLNYVLPKYDDAGYVERMICTSLVLK